MRENKRATLLFLVTLLALTGLLSAAPSEILILHETFEEPLTQEWTIYKDSLVDSTTIVGKLQSYGDGVDGSAGVKIEVQQEAAESWHVQLILPDWEAKADRLYRFTMSAKGQHPVYLSVTQAPNWDYNEGCTFNIYNEYNNYSYLFSSDTAGDGVLRLSLSFGGNAGTYYFDEIKIEEVLQMDPPDTWYQNADKRIEEIRKDDFSVAITNSAELGLIGTYNIELIQHEFKFGTAVNFDTNVVDEPLYKERILENFNSIVTENALKWVDYEPVKGVLDSANFRAYTNFADTNNLTLRGHVLAWGLQKNGFESHWSLDDDAAYLVENLEKRIKREVSYFKGSIKEYDVWNEPIHEKHTFNFCFDENKNYYWLMDSAFHWAHQTDPTAKLYINEYNAVSGGRTETLYDFVKEMLNRGVPISGLGVQCHFEKKKIEPEVIRRRLDILQQLGLDIRVTEFDMGTHDEGLALSLTEMASEYVKFIRTTFSHPAVDGILLWGFTDDKHWVGPVGDNGGAGLYDIYGNPKPALKAVQDLWQKEWHTSLSLPPQESGNVLFRGFYGTYKIQFISENRDVFEGIVDLTEEKQSASVKLINTSTDINKVKKEINSEPIVKLHPQMKWIAIQPNSASMDASLINIKGQVIFEKELTGIQKQQLQLPAIPRGVYFLSLSGNNKTRQMKIVF